MVFTLIGRTPAIAEVGRLYKKSGHIQDAKPVLTFIGILMNFITWLVFGVLLMFCEFATGNFYLLAIGLAFVYPAIAAYVDASTGMQLAVLGSGTLVHVLIVMIARKTRPTGTTSKTSSDVGQQVEVIEWIDESSARVRYNGAVWEADKARDEMPNATHGIIKSVQGNRLIISTEL